MENRKIEVLEHKHQKYVLPDGIVLPSVTTVLGIINKPFLLNWANKLGREGLTLNEGRGDSLLIGTLTHALCESFITKDEVDLTGISDEVITVANVCFEQFKRWVSDLNVEFIGSEITLMDKTIGLGGTIDLVCRVKNELCLVDIKTSKTIAKEYWLQLNAYRQLYERATDTTVDHVGILQLHKDKSPTEYTYTFRTPDPELDSIVQAALTLYKWDKTEK
jgi:hypothetical protein